MTISASLTLNRYITANPAEIAQNKYAQQALKERYAYISMVAFAVLAAVANYFLNPLVLPLTLVYVNFAVLSLASNLVIPRVLELFAEAKKLKAQGDKETAIHEKLEEVRGWGNADITLHFLAHGIDSPYDNIVIHPLLARICYWSDRSEELKNKRITLSEENKCREAMEAGLLAAKAKLKAAYYATLLSTPHDQRKFKDMVDWTDRSLEQLAFEFTSYRNDRGTVARIKGAHPEMLNIAKIHRENIGSLAETLLQNHEDSTTSESDSDSSTIS